VSVGQGINHKSRSASSFRTLGCFGLTRSFDGRRFPHRQSRRGQRDQGDEQGDGAGNRWQSSRLIKHNTSESGDLKTAIREEAERFGGMSWLESVVECCFVGHPVVILLPQLVRGISPGSCVGTVVSSQVYYWKAQLTTLSRPFVFRPLPERDDQPFRSKREPTHLREHPFIGFPPRSSPSRRPF
jgi:hypothetical protein